MALASIHVSANWRVWDTVSRWKKRRKVSLSGGARRLMDAGLDFLENGKALVREHVGGRAGGSFSIDSIGMKLNAQLRGIDKYIEDVVDDMVADGELAYTRKGYVAKTDKLHKTPERVKK